MYHWEEAPKDTLERAARSVWGERRDEASLFFLSFQRSGCFISRSNVSKLKCHQSLNTFVAIIQLIKYTQLVKGYII